MIVQPVSTPYLATYQLVGAKTYRFVAGYEATWPPSVDRLHGSRDSGRLKGSTGTADHLKGKA